MALLLLWLLAGVTALLSMALLTMALLTMAPIALTMAGRHRCGSQALGLACTGGGGGAGRRTVHGHLVGPRRGKYVVSAW